MFDLSQSYQSPLLTVEQHEHLLSLGLPPFPVEPLLGYHLDGLGERKLLFASVVLSDAFLDFLSVHLGEGKVA